MMSRLKNRPHRVKFIKIDSEVSLMKEELSKNNLIKINTLMKKIINVLKIIVIMNFYKKKMEIKMTE
jgi:hypothetical protein